jgi:beta-1,4-mannooligosaccharide/beta-1,4-mannosyl-N-acetylglucosamine phosphorylase
MKESPVIRHPGNPILSAKDIPYEANLVFNAGVVKHRGRYVMLFRDDYNYTKKMFDDWAAGKGELHAPSCRIGLAFSDDGIHWKPEPKPILDAEQASELLGEKVAHAYDPRLTVINDDFYFTFAVNTCAGDNRCGLMKTKDFKTLEPVTATLPNNRNVLLFPERIGGFHYRLERPFAGEAGDIWISKSLDLKFWGEHRRLLNRKTLSFCNSKIGPGAPPVRTERGWLTLFHTVTEVEKPLYSWETPYKEWHSKYSMGLMLLDLKDPSKIVGMHTGALLEPEMPYELEGFRGSVLFPGSMVPEDDGSVKIYYGAADTVECLATARLDDLLDLCKPLQ